MAHSCHCSLSFCRQFLYHIHDRNRQQPINQYVDCKQERGKSDLRLLLENVLDGHGQKIYQCNWLPNGHSKWAIARNVIFGKHKASLMSQTIWNIKPPQTRHVPFWSLVTILSPGTTFGKGYQVRQLFIHHGQTNEHPVAGVLHDCGETEQLISLGLLTFKWLKWMMDENWATTVSIFSITSASIKLKQKWGYCWMIRSHACKRCQITCSPWKLEHKQKWC